MKQGVGHWGLEFLPKGGGTLEDQRGGEEEPDGAHGRPLVAERRTNSKGVRMELKDLGRKIL